MIIKKIVTIKGKKIKALLDTGAEGSFIRYDLAKKLKFVKIKGGKEFIVYAAGWEEYSERGKEITTVITMDRKRFATKLVILKKMSDKLVLGVDFLQHSSIQIDFKTHKVKVLKDKYKYRGLRM